MRTPHKLAHNLALITFLLTLPFLVADATAQVPCATPPAQPEGKITTWKQGATVNVMIDPTFSPIQVGVESHLSCVNCLFTVAG